MKKQTKFGLVLAAAAVISVSVASLVSARGWVQQGADWYYVDNNGEYVTDTIQASGNSKFYLGEDGAMQRDYFLEEYGDSNNAYYFGANGAMVTNTWVAIESSRVENQEDYVPDNYWYYFQASGKAMKAGSSSIKKTTIDGKKYAFNEYGQMLTGWVTSEGKVVNPDDQENPFDGATYYAGGDNDGVLRSGWITYYDGYDGDGPEADYTNLYFYFNTSNNKKYGDGTAETKKINGKTYAFSDEGVMLSGWDPWENADFSTKFTNGAVYFSGEDDGHQVKKGWVYAVPAEGIDSKKYNDDEEVYMYFGASGDITKDQFKKVNGKFYVFDNKGVMKTGVILWREAATGTTSKYVDKLDLDYAEGSELTKKGILRTDADQYIKVNKDGVVYTTHNTDKAKAGDAIKLHLYGSDGARKTGSNTVEFSDDNYTLQTSGSNGDKGSGTFSKKYYALGVQLKASTDIRYGIYNLASTSFGTIGGVFNPQSNGDLADWYPFLANGDYQVLTTGGARLKGNANGKKDADGNYWLVNRNGDTLMGIWTVNASYSHNFGTSWATRKLSTVWADATASYANLVTLGLAIDDAQDTVLAGIVWNRQYDNSGALYFTPQTSFSCSAFQSDYNGGANKWIPMGLTDDAKKTATLMYAACADPLAHAYEVKPNDDYFLNCYWIEK
jgi:glucan-binding YG repeat protein